jgi:hypothetical protein
MSRDSTPPIVASDSTGYVVIINVNEKLPAVARELQRGLGTEQPGRDIVVFVQNTPLWEHHPEWHPVASPPHRIRIEQGCPGDPEALTRAGVQHCHTALILADPCQGSSSDARCALIALAIEHLNPQVHTIIELANSRHRVHLSGNEVNEVVCMGKLKEELITQCTISPGILNVLEKLLTVGNGSPSFHAIPVPEELTGLSYQDAVKRIIEESRPYVVCGYAKPSNKEGGSSQEAVRVLNPGETQKQSILETDDQLIVAG